MRLKVRGLITSIIIIAVLVGCSPRQEIVCIDKKDTLEQTHRDDNAERHTIIQGSNYADPDNWLSLPTETNYDADVLYFYPTCYSSQTSTDPSICSITHEGMRTAAQARLLDQASVFAESTNIYAPYYRQASLKALDIAGQENMLDLLSAEPQADVFAALDYYFEHYNEGRPFFLAGHSQGSMILTLILDVYMEEHPEVYERMVGAYLLGFGATTEWLEKNSHLEMAQREDDTGVIISWNTEGVGNRGFTNLVVPKRSVCINPLNWKTDGTPAGIDENSGSLFQESSGSYVIGEGIADARIDMKRGTVICTSVDTDTYATKTGSLFGPESYHGWDYRFYYANIQENVAVRLKAYLSTQQVHP